jgi:CheY-like chemotaxis protein
VPGAPAPEAGRGLERRLRRYAAVATFGEKRIGDRERSDYSLHVATPGNMARRVLVVDDQLVIAETIKQVLALDECEVETVSSGEDALVAFQQGRFDLIIVDYQMPAMKGDEVASAIRALAPKQPIIMMTAYGEALRLAGSFPLAVDRVIRKPFDLQELREAVREFAAKT